MGNNLKMFLTGVVGGYAIFTIGRYSGFVAGQNTRRPYIHNAIRQETDRRLRDKRCFGCGDKKTKGMPFCRPCFDALPKSHQVNLMQPKLKSHYVVSFNQARAWLHSHRAMPLTFAEKAHELVGRGIALVNAKVEQVA